MSPVSFRKYFHPVIYCAPCALNLQRKSSEPLSSLVHTLSGGVADAPHGVWFAQYQSHTACVCVFVHVCMAVLVWADHTTGVTLGQLPGADGVGHTHRKDRKAGKEAKRSRTPALLFISLIGTIIEQTVGFFQEIKSVFGAVYSLLVVISCVYVLWVPLYIKSFHC